MSLRAETGAPGILRSGDSGGVRAIVLSGAARLAAKVLLVGVICHFTTQAGFAHKIPPHDISPLWPTTAVLFGVLVVSPVRHWWAYTHLGRLCQFHRHLRRYGPRDNR
jgi:integral membrane sensor domain MASE1